MVYGAPVSSPASAGRSRCGAAAAPSRRRSAPPRRSASGPRRALTLVEIATALADAPAARRWFDEIAANDFADLRRDTIWVHAVCQLAAGCAFLGDTSRASALYELPRPYAKRWAVWAEAICYGPVDHYLGLLAHTCRAATRPPTVRVGAGRNHRRRCAALQARTQIEYARLLLENARPGDRERAAALLEAALASARELGMSQLVERALALKRGESHPLLLRPQPPTSNLQPQPRSPPRRRLVGARLRRRAGAAEGQQGAALHRSSPAPPRPGFPGHGVGDVGGGQQRTTRSTRAGR